MKLQRYRPTTHEDDEYATCIIKPDDEEGYLYRVKDVEKLEAENKLLRAGLHEIANDGCGCIGTYRRPDVCGVMYPEDEGEWCWSCIAAKRLKETE